MLKRKNIQKVFVKIMLILFLIVQCVYGQSITTLANDFTIRNSPPDTSNKYYYNSSYNANAGSSDYKMPNCTTYVLGRVYEITGNRFNISGNAKEYYGNNKSYACSSNAYEPALGAVVCYTSSGKGHVQIVEEIGEDSSGKYICVSESNYGGRTTPSQAFNYLKIYLTDLASSTSTGKVKISILEDNDGYSSSQEVDWSGVYLNFQGYIYPDKAGTGASGGQSSSNNVLSNTGVTNITLTSARINAQISPGANVSELGFYWGTDANSMTKKVESFSGYVEGIWYDLGTGKWTSALQPGTTYYYQIYAIINGQTYITDVDSFTTTSTINTRVVDAGTSNITDTTARIDAKITPGANVSELGFYWGTNADSMSKKVESFSGYAESIWYDLGTGKWTSALQKGTTYYYQIYAIIDGITYKTNVGSFTTTGDNTPPQISSVYAMEVNENGYTVVCTVSDDVAVDRVCCPTWTENNGQDDLYADWYNTTVATKIADNTYVYRINATDHNNEHGKYITHVYAYDAAGNYVSVEYTGTFYPVDHNLTPEFPLRDNTIYKIRCVGSDKVIDVPAGSNDNGVVLHQWDSVEVEWQKWKAVKQDNGYSFVNVYNGKAMTIVEDSSYAGVRLTQDEYKASTGQIFKLVNRGDGKYSIHPVCSDMALDVNGGTSDNGAEIMQYFYFGSENQLWTFDLWDSEKPVITDVTVHNVTINGYDVTCTVSDNVGISNVCFPTWTEANWQDDLVDDWYNNAKATSVSGNVYTYHVDIADHNNESGKYFTDIYAYDTSGNYTSIEVTAEVPAKQVLVTGIALNKSQVSLATGTTYALTATVSPTNATNKAVSWKSSNTTVATVDTNGKVTAVGAGSTTITATAADGSGVSASCAVTVTQTVTGITLNKTSLSLKSGETSTLTATVSPSNASNKGVTWKSSNTAVATVSSSGKVTAVSAGSATITATAADGSGISKSCTVTVAQLVMAVDPLEAFVTRMYQQCLSRDPDQNGLDGWVGQLRGGYMNGADIAEQFVFSNEMLSKNLSDEEFVNVLYRSMMGREADANGRAGWVSQLNAGYMTRSEVTKAFVESTEFTEICSSYGITRGTYDASMAPIEHFVTRFYTLCLERKPDQAGLYGWVNNLKNQYMNGAQIADAFIFSDEFVSKNISDEKYVELLYNTLLGRPSDANGKAGWVGELQNGKMTRREMMKAFIESTEFTGICEKYGITRGTME